jgi:UDP-2,3-diacylglucosamine hydrolase
MSDLRTTTLTLGRLTAPAAWQTVDLISDLHLQASETATFEAWRDYMASTPAQAVLILGDLFEVWVGDDAAALDPFLQSCADVLRQASQRLHVAFMPGNRDFLVGPDFLNRCGVQALSDPCLLELGAQRRLRALSESQKHKGMSFADADTEMSLFWLAQTQADRLIHGHTHRPADHPLGTAQRHVLSDWSLDHSPLRAQVFRLHRDNGSERLDLT